MKTCWFLNALIKPKSNFFHEVLGFYDDAKMKIIFFILFCLIIQPSFAQLLYPVVGTYKKMSAQGMAIWGDQAVLFNKGGHCRVLDLKTVEVIREFNLASSGNSMHVATACFGNESYGENALPLVYLAEFEGKSRCFVESIGKDSSILVQTIEAKENGKNYRIQCWVVDKDSPSLYSVSGKQEIDAIGQCPVVIRKYRLPKSTEGEYVLLTESDKQDQFLLSFPNCLQGATIRKGKLYIVTGLQESQRDNPRGKRSLKVIDLNKKVLINEIDLTYITTNEPEGLDFYHNRLMMSCGQEGGIYRIKFK